MTHTTRVENKLARNHLNEGTLILYDVTSSYYTGRRPGLVQFGYNRDGKRGVPQIVYGLLCNAKGCPVAIEVFAGNTADPKTLGVQIAKVRRRFGVRRVVFVGDRGMITSRRIDEELRGVDGLDWITALRADHIRLLAEKGVIQRSLFDERDLDETNFSGSGIGTPLGGRGSVRALGSQSRIPRAMRTESAPLFPRIIRVY
jgi:hypothetical protein